MKEKFYRFMQGRYGYDQFSKFLVIVGLVLFLISNIFPKTFLSIIPLAILIIAYFRTFSKDHQRRYKENQWYLKQKTKLTYRLDNFKHRKTVTNPYHIFKCPKCKQKLRIPKGKGKIEVTCKSCSHKFIKKS